MDQTQKIIYRAEKNTKKLSNKLRKKQEQELNTMRMATETKLGTHPRNRGHQVIKNKYANHKIKDNPLFNLLNYDKQLEAIYGNILSNNTVLEDGNPEKLDKRLIIQ